MKTPLLFFVILFLSLKVYAQPVDEQFYLNGEVYAGINKVYCDDTCMTLSTVVIQDGTNVDHLVTQYVWKVYFYQDPNTFSSDVDLNSPDFLSNDAAPVICFSQMPQGFAYVRLTVVGNFGNTTGFDHWNTIFKVVTCPPVASFSGDDVICQGSCVSFTDQSFKNPTQWTWECIGASPEQLNGKNAEFCFLQAGSYVVKLTVSNDGGSDIYSKNIAVKASPQIGLPNDTVICNSDTIVLDANVLGADSWGWNSLDSSLSLHVSQGGNYVFSATFEGCVSYDSTYVDLMLPPYINWENEIIICSDESFTLSAEQKHPSNYLWNNGSSGASLIVDSGGTYSVFVQNTCGESKAQIEVVSKDCACVMFIPNAFTPDGSDYNEVFKPVFDCRIKNYEMYIYNRWGQLIFTTSDPLYGWNGQFEGKPAPMDVYVALIKYAGLDVKNFLQKESRYILTLLR